MFQPLEFEERPYEIHQAKEKSPLEKRPPDFYGLRPNPKYIDQVFKGEGDEGESEIHVVRLDEDRIEEEVASNKEIDYLIFENIFPTSLNNEFLNNLLRTYGLKRVDFRNCVLTKSFIRKNRYHLARIKTLGFYHCLIEYDIAGELKGIGEMGFTTFIFTDYAEHDVLPVSFGYVKNIEFDHIQSASLLSDVFMTIKMGNDTERLVLRNSHMTKSVLYVLITMVEQLKNIKEYGFENVTSESLMTEEITEKFSENEVIEHLEFSYAFLETRSILEILKAQINRLNSFVYRTMSMSDGELQTFFNLIEKSESLRHLTLVTNDEYFDPQTLTVIMHAFDHNTIIQSFDYDPRMFPPGINEKITSQLEFNNHRSHFKRPRLELESEPDLPLHSFKVSVDMESIPRNQEKEVLFQSIAFTDDDARIINEMKTTKWSFRNCFFPIDFFEKIRESLIKAKRLLFEGKIKIDFFF